MARWREALRYAGFEIILLEDWGAHQKRTYQLLKESLCCGDTNQEATQRAIQRIDLLLNAAEAGRLKRAVLIAEKRHAAPAVPSKPAAPARKRSTLVMLSGGIDSVYVLWKLLTESDDEIIAHHINFVNNERRHVIEAQRCRQIVSYLRRSLRPFEYTESTLDHRAYAFFGYDMVAVGFEAGLAAHSHLFRKNRPIDRWTFGACVEEEIGVQGRWPHVLACCAANCFPHEAPEFFALPTVTKQEEVHSLPPDLVNLSWGCRRPVMTESGYRACGICKTCKLLRSVSGPVA